MKRWRFKKSLFYLTTAFYLGSVPSVFAAITIDTTNHPSASNFAGAGAMSNTTGTTANQKLIFDNSWGTNTGFIVDAAGYTFNGEGAPLVAFEPITADTGGLWLRDVTTVNGSIGTLANPLNHLAAVYPAVIDIKKDVYIVDDITADGSKDPTALASNARMIIGQAGATTTVKARDIKGKLANGLILDFFGNVTWSPHALSGATSSSLKTHTMGINTNSTLDLTGSIDLHDTLWLNAASATLKISSNLNLSKFTINGGNGYGNLVFTGPSAVTFTTPMAGNSLGSIITEHAAGNVSFNNTLRVDAINVNSTGTLQLPQDVNMAVNPAATKLITFNADGILEVNGGTGTNLTATGGGIRTSVANTTTGTGTVRLKRNNILGDIGTSTNMIKLVEIGEIGGATIAGNINALNTNFKAANTSYIDGNITSAVNFDANSTVYMNGSTLDGSVANTSGFDCRGVIEFTGAATTITGNVGASGAGLYSITGGTGFDTTYGGRAVACYIYTGANTSNFNGAIQGANLTFTADGTVNMAGSSLFTDVTNNLSGNGTFNITGNTTLESTKSIGSLTNELKVVNLSKTAGMSSTLNGPIYAINIENGAGTSNVNVALNTLNPINFTADGTINYNLATLGNDITTSSNGTGTFNFVNTSAITVSKNLGASGSALKVITGGTAANTTYNNQIFAQTINSGANISNFAGNLTGNLNFTADGTANMAGSTLTGNVTTNTANTGTLNLTESSTVTGNIGATNRLKLITTGAASKTNVFNGTVAATNITSNTGTSSFNGDVSITGGNISFTGDGIINVGDATVTSAINTGTGSTGTLNIIGNGTVTGNVGATNALKLVTAGSAAKTANFSGTITADDVTIGAGTANFADDITASISFTADGIINVADTVLLNGTVDSDVPNAGTLNLLGDNTVSGNIGATNALKLVTGGASGKTTNFSNAVTATTVNTGAGISNFAGNVSGNPNFTADGTAAFFGSDIAGNITTATNNTGTVRFYNASTNSITGDIGSSGAELNQSVVQTSATLNATGNIYSNSIILENDSNLNVTGNIVVTGNNYQHRNANATSTINGNITTKQFYNWDVGYGNLIFTAPSTISQTLAMHANHSFKSITTQHAAGNIAFNQSINTDTINIDNTGTLIFHSGADLTKNGTATKLATFNADGILEVNTTSGNFTATGGGVRTSVGNGITGTVKLKQNTFTGSIGANGAAIKLLEVSETANSTIVGNIYATTIDFKADRQFTVNSATVEGNITTTAGNNTGSLTLTGTASTVTGDIGTSGAALKTVTGGTGFNTTYNGGVVASTINTGANISNFNGNVSGNLNFTADGTVNMAGSMLTGNLTTATTNEGTLNLTESSTINGNIGTGANLLKIINAGAVTKTNIFNGDIYATAVNFSGDGVIEIANGKNINSAVTTNAVSSGTLKYLGSTNLLGDIGTALNPLKEVQLLSGAVSFANNDIYADTLLIDDTATLNIAGTRNIHGNVLLDGTLDLGSTVGDKLIVYGNLDAGADPLSTFVKIKSDISDNTSSAALGQLEITGNMILRRTGVLEIYKSLNPIDSNGTYDLMTIQGSLLDENMVPISTASLKDNYLISKIATVNITNVNKVGNIYQITLQRDGNGLAGIGNPSKKNPAKQSALDTLDAIYNKLYTDPDYLASVNPGFKTALDQINALTTDEIDVFINRLTPDAMGSFDKSIKESTTNTLNTIASRLDSIIGSSSFMGSTAVTTGFTATNDLYHAIIHEDDNFSELKELNLNAEPTSHGFWMQGLSNYIRQKSVDNYSGYTARNNGSIIGLDTQLNDSTTLGIALTSTKVITKFKEDKLGDNLKANIKQASVYSKHEFNPKTYLNLIASLSHIKARTLSVKPLNELATAKFKAKHYGVKGELHHSLAPSRYLTLTPSVSLNYQHLNKPSYTEIGSVFARTYSKDQEDTLNLSFGTNMALREVAWQETTILPEVYAKVNFDLIRNDISVNSYLTQAGPIALENSRGPKLPRTALTLGSTLTLINCNNYKFAVSTDVELRKNFFNVGALLRFKLDF
ncbi:autotransporter domain-containing protein [Rickettsiales endosymbiont of Stachyamoeba lipophora]|uniref:autotransporter domain-containing protein n=1 Tax=Rickettsiales endosymbiont of Stachyamoeba lipophora TaxID=2486578 RepID=UPI000F652E22|nr:autotransporter domain-containing protein [Rickettsiales endosymbiont of Stachyamoeba lipophora]AZL16272.1 autotransporter domain-containing protein [Rickettsiales endosymbiont of Stachyamoeba lipophora]